MGSRSGRYLAGLGAASLALCAGGWLTLVPYALGYRGRMRVTALASGGGVAVLAVLSLVCWALAWRRRLRADGVLPVPAREAGPRTGSPAAQARQAQSRSERRSARRQARAERLVRDSRQRDLAASPDPARVLTDLRDLLTPLLAEHAMPAVVRVPAPTADVPDGGAGDGDIAMAECGHAPPAQDPPRQDGGVRRAVELLVVGGGEEESW